MIELRIGDPVTFRGRAYLVRGMSPMGVLLRRVQLEDALSGEHLNALVDDLDAELAPSFDRPKADLVRGRGRDASNGTRTRPSGGTRFGGSGG